MLYPMPPTACSRARHAGQAWCNRLLFQPIPVKPHCGVIYLSMFREVFLEPRGCGGEGAGLLLPARCDMWARGRREIAAAATTHELKA